MASNPVPGANYARLSAADYQRLKEFFDADPYNPLAALLQDFHEGVDRYWYAAESDIDPDELDLLLEYDIDYCAYIYSVWYTGNL